MTGPMNALGRLFLPTAAAMVLALLMGFGEPSAAHAGQAEAPPAGHLVVSKVVPWPPDPNAAWMPPDWAWLDRILNAQPERLVFDTGQCLEPRWASEHLTWGRLIAQSFPAVDTLLVNYADARPADLGIPVAPSAVAQVWRAHCKDDHAAGPWGAAWLRPQVGEWRERSGEYRPGPGNWWARTPSGQWLMRDGDRLLFLKPFDHRRAPRPSFSCAKKPLDALRTAICADHDLANWDRSAALAWQRGFKARQRFLAFMKDEHQTWLQELQNCMDNGRQTPRACLLEQFQAAVAYNRGN